MDDVPQAGKIGKRSRGATGVQETAASSRPKRVIKDAVKEISKVVGEPVAKKRAARSQGTEYGRLAWVACTRFRAMKLILYFF